MIICTGCELWNDCDYETRLSAGKRGRCDRRVADKAAAISRAEIERLEVLGSEGAEQLRARDAEIKELRDAADAMAEAWQKSSASNRALLREMADLMREHADRVMNLRVTLRRAGHRLSQAIHARRALQEVASEAEANTAHRTHRVAREEKMKLSEIRKARDVLANDDADANEWEEAAFLARAALPALLEVIDTVLAGGWGRHVKGSLLHAGIEVDE